MRVVDLIELQPYCTPEPHVSKNPHRLLRLGDFRHDQTQQFISSVNMLYIVGLGLADERDVSVKGLDIIRKADRVYLEAYTAVLLVDKDALVRTTQGAFRNWYS